MIGGTSQRVVLVSGLSGAGKASTLKVLEDLGYDAIDNPPICMIEALAERAGRPGAAPVAIGVDVRSAGFDAGAVIAAIDAIRQMQGIQPCLVFLWASEATLLGRFTATRRRHPLSGTSTIAGGGTLRDGIAAEQQLTRPLWTVADLSIDTSDLALPDLRRRIEIHFQSADRHHAMSRLSPTLISFAFPGGLPREADMVLDARFLRNPHYIEALKAKTGLDAPVKAYVEDDPYFPPFFGQLAALLDLVLPRFVVEGKRYVTIAVGCTGGRHRSVCVIERLHARLVEQGWRPAVIHRELSHEHAGPAPIGPEDAAVARREKALYP